MWFIPGRELTATQLLVPLNGVGEGIRRVKVRQLMQQVKSNFISKEKAVHARPERKKKFIDYFPSAGRKTGLHYM